MSYDKRDEQLAANQSAFYAGPTMNGKPIEFCVHERIQPLSEKYTGDHPFVCLECGKRFTMKDIYGNPSR
jgi:hypothetical protein